MFKNFIAILAAAMLVAACGGEDSQEVAQQSVEQTQDVAEDVINPTVPSVSTEIWKHYDMFHKVKMPRGKVVTICSGHGCQIQNDFVINEELHNELVALMNTSSPEAEREAFAAAISLFEKKVGEVLGTSEDKPGTSFLGGGDPTQMDSVDETTNSMSLLIYLHSQGLIKYHHIHYPVQWYKNRPYFAVVISEVGARDPSKMFVIDSHVEANGGKVYIIPWDKWK